MALQVCKECGTRYAPAAKCPNCGANEWVSELEADAAAEDAPVAAAAAVKVRPPVRPVPPEDGGG